MDNIFYREKHDDYRRNISPHSSLSILRPKSSKPGHLSKKKYPVLKFNDIPISKLRSQDLEESRESIDRLEEQNVALMKDIVELKKTSEILATVCKKFNHEKRCEELRLKRKKQMSSGCNKDFHPPCPGRSETISSLGGAGSIESVDIEFFFPLESKDEVDYIGSRKGARKLSSDSDPFCYDWRKQTDSRPLSCNTGKVTDSRPFGHDLEKVINIRHMSDDSMMKVTRSGTLSPDLGHKTNSKASSNGWRKITDSGTIKSSNGQDVIDFVGRPSTKVPNTRCSLSESSETKVNGKGLNLLEPEIKCKDFSDYVFTQSQSDKRALLPGASIKDTNLSQTTVPSPDYLSPVSPSLNSQSTPESPASQYGLQSPESVFFSDETSSSPNFIFPHESIEFEPIESTSQCLGLNSFKTPDTTFSSNLNLNISTSHTRMNEYPGKGFYQRHLRPSTSGKCSMDESEINQLKKFDNVSRRYNSSKHMDPKEVEEQIKKERIKSIMDELITTSPDYNRIKPDLGLHRPYFALDIVSKSSAANEDGVIYVDASEIGTFECDVFTETIIDDVSQTNTEQLKENTPSSECPESFKKTCENSPELLDITERISKISCDSSAHEECKKAETASSESETTQMEATRRKRPENEATKSVATEGNET